MNLEKLRKKKLSQLKISELRAIMHDKHRGDLCKENLLVRIYSKVSPIQSKFLALLGFNADGITYLWGTLSLLSTFLLWFGNYWTNLAFLGIFFIAYFLDFSDGEIARYLNWRNNKKGCGLFGLYLDQMIHFFERIFIFIGIGIGAWINSGLIIYFYMAIGLIICIMFDHIIKLREADMLINLGYINLLNKNEAHRGKDSGKLKRVYELFKPQSMHRGLFLWALLFNLLNWFLIITFVLSVLLLAKTARIRIRRMKRFNDEICERLNRK